MTAAAASAGRVVVLGLRRHWPAFLATHVAFAALGFAVLTPLVGLAIRLLLALGGRDVVADQDIVWFLLSPLGLVSLVAVAALIIAIVALELAALMTITAGHMHGRRVGAIVAVRFAASRALPVLRLAARVVARMLLILAPFLAVAAVAAWLLLTEYDINYYLSARPTEFIVVLGIVALLTLAAGGLLAYRLVAWSLAMPLVLFSGASVPQALARSATMTDGRRWHFLGLFAAWLLLGLLLGAVGTVTLDLLGSWLVPRVTGSLTALVLVIGLLVVIAALGNLFITAILNGSLALLVMDWFGRCGSRIDERVLWGPVEGESARAAGLSARVLATLIAIACVATAAVGWWLLAASRLPDKALVVAHRGAAGRAPENTLASIRAAIEDGADWIEIDVQETVDGEVVVVHDSDFMKLAGVSRKVWDVTLEELQRIDVGSWFAPDFTGESVPTLRAVLEQIRGSDSRLVIELKYYGHDQQLEQRVVDLVETAGIADRVAIMSLSYPGVAKLRRLRPDWTTGLLVATAIGNLNRLDTDFLAVNTGMATARFVRRTQRAGRQVFVWTVNDPVSMSRMMSLGVDGIITDEPAMAREVLKQRATMNPAERLLLHAALLFGRPVPGRAYRDDSP